jgi:hypothetical protein
MNIFATSDCPEQSAIVLPDQHINKMPVECCQMLAYVASPYYKNYGTLPRINGEPYKTTNLAHLRHPCTKWAAESIHNASWLIYHAFMLLEEFERRYGHKHGSYETLLVAYNMFPEGKFSLITPFARSMDDVFKFDTTIDTFTAYKRYIASKPWVRNNYVRKPERKPEWI